MSGSVDSRVAELKFDNSQFESGVKQSLKTVESLNKGLKLDNSTQGFKQIADAARGVNLEPIADGISNVAQKFSALGIMATTTLVNMTNRAIDFGVNFAKSIVVAPISDGFAEYELKMGSIQTIMAGSGASLDVVNKKLEELNTYADRTIYSFGDMTANIGKFTNAGVDLDTSVGAIQGIANVAAISGANANEASRAMYNFSQALSKGYVQLIDWKSIELANMGTVEFKQQLIDAAVAAGTLKDAGDGMYKTLEGKTLNATKNFNDSLTDQWMTTQVLTETLGNYSDETTDIGKRAFAAAQDVKTFSQMIDTMKESVGSGWAQSFEIIFGDFDEAKVLWTSINNAFGGWVDQTSDMRNNLLKGWKELGGRTAIIDGITNALRYLGDIIKPITDAFANIFPPITAQMLADISTGFLEFTQRLQVSSETADKIQRTFSGLFAIFGIAVEVIKALWTGFTTLTAGAGGFASEILDLTAKVGDFLTNLLGAVRGGDDLDIFFTNIARAIRIPIDLLVKFGTVIRDALGKINAQPILDFFQKLGGYISAIRVPTLSEIGAQLSGLFDSVGSAALDSGPIEGFWNGILGVFTRITSELPNIIKRMIDDFSGITEAIAGIFDGVDYAAILDTVQTGLLGGFVVMIGKFLGGLKGQGGDAKAGIGGFIESLTSPLEALTGVLGEMQNTLRAATLLQIAIAVGILAASVSTLSKIDAESLNRAISALALLFGQLVLAMAAFQKIDIRGGMTQLILVAIALRILTSSVEAMADLDWDGLAKGLLGTAALLGMLIGVAHAMPNGKRLGATGVGMILLAAGVRILVESVEALSQLSWGELARGLVGVAGILGSLAIFSKLVSVNKIGIGQGIGIILLAAGLKILASAVKDFSGMSWEEIGKGLAGVAGGLVSMAIGLKLLPPSSIFSAIAILIVAQSLSTIADAMKQMGDISWDSIGRGLTVMAGSLVAIAIALKLLPAKSIISAVSILIVAQALGAIGDAVTKMGSNDWGQVARGLTVMAGALGMISLALGLLPPSSLLSAAAIFIAAQALSGIVDAVKAMGDMGWEAIAIGLVGLGGALGIIAGAMMLMTGALPGAAALVIVAAALTLLMPVLLAFSQMNLEELLMMLGGLAGVFVVLGLAGLILGPLTPVIMGLGVAFALLGVGVLAAGVGMLAFGLGLGAVAAAGAAGTAALVGLVTAVISLLPQFAVSVGEAIVALAVTIGEGAPAIVEALVAILLSLLQAVIDLAPPLGEAAVVLILTLLDAIMAVTPDIIAAILSLLSQLLAAIVAFVPELVVAGMDLIIGVLNGIASRIGDVITAAADIIVAFLNGISTNLPRIVQSGVDLIISFVNGIANAIRDNARAMQDAGINLASAIVEGMVSGIARGATAVVNAAKNLAKKALDSAKNFLGIHSPSKEFEKLGKFSAEGFAKGLAGGRDDIVEAQRGLLDLLGSTKEAIEKNIADQDKKLKTLNKNRRKNRKEIAEVTAALKESRLELAKVNAATKTAGTFGDDISKLTTFSDKLADVTEKLADANDALEDAIKTRDDYADSIKDQYGQLDAIAQDTKLTDYTKDLEQRITDTQIYASQLQELRKRGLNDEMYRELLGAGVAGSDFAKQILEGGNDAVAQLNSLSESLAKTSESFGTASSKALYQAAVDSAAGLVKGLQNQESAIQLEMSKIAKYMVGAIKKELGIKSPSRVFASIGGDIVNGLAVGLGDSSAAVSKMRGLSGDILTAMSETLGDLDGSTIGDMTLNPVIRPVLDLSTVSRDASHIQNLLSTRPLDVRASSGYARSTAQELNERSDYISRRDYYPIGEGLTYNQYNYSPKSLSSVEIYRNTKNQLSTVRGALGQT